MKSLFTVIALFLFTLSLHAETCSQSLALPLSELNLTAAEEEWLESTKSIRIAGPRAFPPFHYYDEEGKLKGISADYICMILNQLGIEIKIENDLPWPDVLKKAKAGEIDLIPCIAISEDRKEYLDFSKPYLSFPLVILTQKDAPFIGGIEDLHGKRLALIKNNVTSAWLDRDGIKYKPVYVKSPREGLEALSLGTVDATIENLAAASYLIQSYGLTNIKIAAPTPYGNYNLHMAVRKDEPELLGIINSILDWITPQQHSQIRSKWLSIRYEYGIRKIDVIKWVVITVLIATVILGVILIWNRKLQDEIAARKVVIEKLKQALAEIKTLKGILPICSNCKKIRDDQGYWNRLEAYFEEHSDTSFTHSLCPECEKRLYGSEEWYRDKDEHEKD